MRQEPASAQSKCPGAAHQRGVFVTGRRPAARAHRALNARRQGTGAEARAAHTAPIGPPPAQLPSLPTAKRPHPAPASGTRGPQTGAPQASAVRRKGHTQAVRDPLKSAATSLRRRVGDTILGPFPGRPGAREGTRGPGGSSTVALVLNSQKFRGLPNVAVRTRVLRGALGVRWRPRVSVCCRTNFRLRCFTGRRRPPPIGRAKPDRMSVDLSDP